MPRDFSQCAYRPSRIPPKEFLRGLWSLTYGISSVFLGVLLLLLLLVRFNVNEPNYAAHYGGGHEKDQGPEASWQLVQVVDGRGGLGGHRGGGGEIGWVGRIVNESLENGSGKGHGHSTVGVLHIHDVLERKKDLGPGETRYTST